MLPVLVARRVRAVIGLFAAALLGVLLAPATARAAVAWTGTGGTSWSTTTSWSPNGSGPATTDTATFSDTGSSTLAGDLTSLLNTPRTIGGLSFSDSNSHFHTLDLNSFTLTDTGLLSFNQNQSGSTITTLRNGTFTLNGASANFYSGYSSSTTANSVVDLSGLAALNMTVQNMLIGVSTTSNNATGTVTLSTTNSNITATLIQVGNGTSGGGNGTGTLHFGKLTTINASEFDIGRHYSSGNTDITSGGTLNLGSAAARTDLYIGSGSLNTNTQFNGKLDMTGGTLNAYLNNVIVGQKDISGGYGGGTGTFLGGTGGSVNIGASGTNTANFIVGSISSGGGSVNANGIVDFSGVTTVNANLNAFNIGTAVTESGSAQGTVTLGATNTINALSILVGNNGGNISNLNLGKTNTIITPTFTIGQDYSSGSVTIPSAGSLTLGTSSARTDLYVGSGNVNTNSQFTGSLNLTGATFNAYLGQLMVGVKNITGGYGGGTGTIIGGSSGTVSIGAPGTNTANFEVGVITNGTGAVNATGNVDFSGISSLSANLNTFQIGTAATTGAAANGTVTLGASNTINALSILIGNNTRTANTLNLGTTNTIATPSFKIGADYSSGTVNITTGGSLSLGSAAQRTDLYVGSGAVNTNDQFTGALNLTGATFNAYLGSLIVGQKDVIGGYGGGSGTLTGAVGGSVDIGASGNTANFFVGRMLDGGGNTNASGTVDFSGLATLNANLNSLAIGVAVSQQSSSVQGAVKLAQSNNINALSIIVGSSGTNTNTLVLGKTNTILVNQFTIAQDYANGSVTIPSGGTLTLGSAAQRANLSIATGVTNTSTTYTGTLDLTNATFIGYLGNVIIGNKDSQNGGENGTLTISNKSNNFIDATSIALGGTKSTGTLNFGGGQLYAGSITNGPGTANFNWTGGQLSVTTFGQPTSLFNLNNTGTGTLAPGTSAGAIGTTTINGNYTQSSSAAMNLRIAGSSPTTGNDQVNISGTATLAGALNLSTINGFVPSVGQNYLLATYGSRSGAFSFVAPPSLPQNVAFQLDYSSVTQLYARMVAPVTQNFIGTGSLSTFSATNIWDTQSTPTTSSALTIANTGASAKTVTLNGSTTVHAITLTGPGSTMDLEIPQGIKLGVAYQLQVGAGGVLSGGGQVLGNVVVAGGGTVAPGATSNVLSVAGNLTSTTGSTLALNLAGSSAGQYDQIAAGQLALGGTLQINDLNGYTPTPGTTFQLFQAGSITGQFDSYNLPAIPGAAWDASQLSTTGQISVVVPEPAAMSGLVLVAAAMTRRRFARKTRA